MEQNVIYVGIDVDDVRYHPVRCWIFLVDQR
jgi:hypothetical protein